MKIKSVDYSIVDHCNLNCAGCSHFSPIAELRFASLERFEKNIIKLSSYNLNIEQFNLLGGEPLLHTQIKDFILVSKKYLKTNIVVKTNGILLNDDFIRFCDKHNVTLVVANYGLNIKHTNNPLIDDFMYNYIGTIPIEFNSCVLYNTSYNNSCSQLEDNGDLHFCTYSANIKHYNKFYNTNIPTIKDRDYVNIYDNDFMKKYFMGSLCRRPFCNYCRPPKIKPWHLFNKINEWVDISN